MNGVYLLEYWKLRNSSHTFFAVCKINLQFINVFSPYVEYNGKSHNVVHNNNANTILERGVSDVIVLQLESSLLSL